MFTRLVADAFRTTVLFYVPKIYLSAARIVMLRGGQLEIYVIKRGKNAACGINKLIIGLRC